MKKRTQFVANSSSSSFVILGKKVTLGQIDLSSGKNYVALGKYIGEGQDVFKVNESLLPYLGLFEDQFSFIESVFYGCEWTEQAKISGGTYDVVCGTEDMHSTETVEELMERYEVEPPTLLDLWENNKISTELFVVLGKGKIKKDQAADLLRDGAITLEQFLELAE